MAALRPSKRGNPIRRAMAAIALMAFATSAASVAAPIAPAAGNGPPIRSATQSSDNPSSGLDHLTVLGEDILFAADDGVSGAELWRYRPRTDELVMVKDILPGPRGSNPTDFVRVNEAVYFIADNGVHGMQLWRSEGADETTGMVARLGDGSRERRPRDLKAFNGALLFRADDAQRERKLWRTDGDAKSTVALQTSARGPKTFDPSEGAECAGLFYFWADNALWSTDGTPSGTRKQTDALPKGVIDGDRHLVAVNRKLVLQIATADTGQELWALDPAAVDAGWTLLRDIYPGRDGSSAQQFVAFAGYLYFQARDPDHGAELWRTDGTPDGTVLAADLAPGQASGLPQYFAVAGPNMFFTATDPTNGRELWVTQSAINSAHIAKDVYPGRMDGTPYQLTPFGSGLYFSVNNPDYGEELWFSDGSEAGTHLVRDINPGKASAEPFNLVVIDRRLYFAANDSVHGEELWSSDGTEAGTQLVADIKVPPGAIASSNPSRLTELNGRLVFFARNVQGLYTLYTSEGSDLNTRPTDSSLPPQLDVESMDIVTNGAQLVLLAANSGAPGRTLWATDGTAQGSQKLDVLEADSPPTERGHLALMNNTLYYTKRNREHGSELWSYGLGDGSATRVADLCPGAQGSSPHELTVWKNALFFVATDAEQSIRLWRYDGDAGAVVDVSASRSAHAHSHSGLSLLYCHGRSAWPRIVAIRWVRSALDTSGGHPARSRQLTARFTNLRRSAAIFHRERRHTRHRVVAK